MSNRRNYSAKTTREDKDKIPTTDGTRRKKNTLTERIRKILKKFYIMKIIVENRRILRNG
jgi:hypothetical protein